MIRGVARFIVKRYPDIIPLLSWKVRYIASKSFDDLLSRIEELVTAAYNGDIGTVEFVDDINAALESQIDIAFWDAWYEYIEGGESLPAYLRDAAAQMIKDLTKSKFAYQYYKDIMLARRAGSGVESVLSRADLWANRYNEAYNRAWQLIQAEEGGKLIWRVGATEHCNTCQGLDGVVATGAEWDRSGYYPQGAPNGMLECGGWRCQCSLSPTDAKLSRNRRAKLGI